MTVAAQLETPSKLLEFSPMLNQPKNCPPVHYTILLSICHRRAAYLINKVNWHGISILCNRYSCSRLQIGDPAHRQATQTDSNMGVVIRCQPKPGQFSAGQTLAEYTIVLLVVVVIVYGAYVFVGNNVAALVTSATAAF
jgi:hypothetical protein